MPYKVEGTTVMKQESDGTWVVEKKHPSVKAAYKQLKALRANVEGKEHKGK
jgi:hypothetical protein